MSKREAFLAILCVAAVSALCADVSAHHLADSGGASAGDSIRSVAEVGAGGPSDPAAGSGFVVLDGDGRKAIATNAHVVIDALGAPRRDIRVSLFGCDRCIPAEVSAFDRDLDIAILAPSEPVDADPLKLGDSRMLSYGEPVRAIGNSAGLGLSVASGAVSVPLALVKHKGVEREMIQTDVSLNHGGSGGPLLNQKGEAIGMMTLRYVGSDQSVFGVSYAIPSDAIRSFIEARAG
ncbi:MAG: S1C family serine protease [Candidatus Methanoplasma sp.]|nr:S1C family serine protease [Candidatus Methanoplasma sp.]